MKPVRCLVFMLLLIQSFSIVDAGAREAQSFGSILLPYVTMADAAMDVPDNTTPVKFDRLDRSIDAIIPSDAMVERVATGFTWVEGPIWIPAGYLLFAEITSNSIRKVTPDGTVSIFMQPSGYKG